MVWNKFRWEKDPETGRRVPQVRPREEWIVGHTEELRIIADELWERVKSRQREFRKRAGQFRRTGRPPKYLFSGLLVCGSCGARFVMRGEAYYGCSFHVNRGPTVCKNALVVRRLLLEERLLQVIRQELFTPDAVAYVTQRLNVAIQAKVRERQTALADRRRLEHALGEATAELENIMNAIRRGLISDLTKQMLEEAEARVRDLREQLAKPTSAQLHALAALPRLVQDQLQDLQRVLDQDVDRARAILRRLLGEIVLHPKPEGLVAELRGNVEGLLALGQQAPMSVSMVAGACNGLSLSQSASPSSGSRWRSDIRWSVLSAREGDSARGRLLHRGLLLTSSTTPVPWRPLPSHALLSRRDFEGPERPI